MAKKAKRKNKAVSTKRRAIRYGAAGAAVLLLVPVILSAAYALVDPPVTTLMLWRSAQGQERRWEWRSLKDMSPHMVAAVVSAEDGQFCHHHGVDWGQVRKVIETVRHDPEKPVRGASTITMQAARTLFLWPSRSVVRKAFEVPLALWLDLVLSKRRLLEIYLNVVEWAPGVYGAGAASRFHFGRDVRRLSRTQAALLAATLPAPFKRRPGKPTTKLTRLAGVYTKRMETISPYLDCVK